MTTPIEIPVSTPGSANAKQQTDALRTSIAGLDETARRYTQTSGQATTVTNQQVEAFKRKAAEVRKAAAEEAAATAKTRENTAATQAATRAVREKEAAYNKMGEAIGKMAPAAGQGIKALGSQIGAVGLAATAVGSAINAAFEAINHSITKAAEAPAKMVRALNEAREMLNDARTARGSSAGGVLNSNRGEVMRGLAVIAGDAAVYQAMDMAPELGRDPTKIMEAMIELRNAGMSQEQAVSAIRAANEGDLLRFGSFSDLIGKAAGVSGTAFKGRGYEAESLKAILDADVKHDPEAEAKAALRHRQAFDQRQSYKAADFAVQQAQEEESWQRKANKYMSETGGTLASYEAMFPRPRVDTYQQGAYQAPVVDPGGVSLAEIKRRRAAGDTSGIVGQVDPAAVSAAHMAVMELIAALDFGATGAAQDADNFRNELMFPGSAAFNKRQRQLQLEIEATGLEAEGLEGWHNWLPERWGGTGRQALEARRKHTSAIESSDRLTEGARQSGLIPTNIGTADNPLHVIQVNMPPAPPRTAAPE